MRDFRQLFEQFDTKHLKEREYRGIHSIDESIDYFEEQKQDQEESKQEEEDTQDRIGSLPPTEGELESPRPLQPKS